MNTQDLKALGLEENEIKVYLTCLQEERLNVKEISKRTNLIRTTVYGILTSLQHKGLIASAQKDKILVFSATSPKELLNLMDQKRDKIAAIIPELEKMHTPLKTFQKVEFYEGINGVNAITNDTISNTDGKVKIIGSANAWLEFSPGFNITYYRKKKERKIKTETILNDDKKERQAIKHANIHNSTFRFIPKLNLSSGAVFIYQNKVSFANYDKEQPRGFVIEDQEFNKIMNICFDDLWNKAKE